MKSEQKALFFNILVNIFVSLVKIIGGIFFFFFILFIDKIYTFIYLVTDVISLMGIKIGRKRANKNHPYGYGKIFYVVELFMGILALLVGAFVIYVSFQIDYEKPPIGIVFLIIGLVVLKLISAKNLSVVGMRKKSELLIVSSYESRMEAFSSLGLVIIVILSQFITKIDMIGGIVIAVFLIWQAIREIKQNIDYLIGITYEDEKIKEKVKKIVDKYRVIDMVDQVLIQDGPYYQLILTLKVKKNITVKSMLRVQNKIKKELKAKAWGLKFIEFRLV